MVGLGGIRWDVVDDQRQQMKDAPAFVRLWRDRPARQVGAFGNFCFWKFGQGKGMYGRGIPGNHFLCGHSFERKQFAMTVSVIGFCRAASFLFFPFPFIPQPSFLRFGYSMGVKSWRRLADIPI